MTHMKVQTAPTTWKIKKKGSKFIVRANPGKKYELSIPISLILKNILKYCKTTKEVKSILNKNTVIIDGKRRKDYRYPVGVMDPIEFKTTKENYRTILNKQGKIDLIKIDKKEASIKPSKINAKKILEKNKIQLNLSDGRNIIVKKDDYSVGDTLVLKLPEQKIQEVIKLEKKSFVLLYLGKKKGTTGIIEEILHNHVKIKCANGDLITTSKEYAFVIGKNKPIIRISD